MIYIPIELQLQWIREDLEAIKRAVCPMHYIKPPPICPDCSLARLFGITTCNEHAPEFNVRIALD